MFSWLSGWFYGQAAETPAVVAAAESIVDDSTDAAPPAQESTRTEPHNGDSQHTNDNILVDEDEEKQSRQQAWDEQNNKVPTGPLLDQDIPTHMDSAPLLAPERALDTWTEDKLLARNPFAASSTDATATTSGQRFSGSGYRGISPTPPHTTHAQGSTAYFLRWSPTIATTTTTAATASAESSGVGVDDATAVETSHHVAGADTALLHTEILEAPPAVKVSRRIQERVAKSRFEQRLQRGLVTWTELRLAVDHPLLRRCFSPELRQAVLDEDVMYLSQKTFLSPTPSYAGVVSAPAGGSGGGQVPMPAAVRARVWRTMHGGSSSGAKSGQPLPSPSSTTRRKWIRPSTNETLRLWA